MNNCTSANIIHITNFKSVIYTQIRTKKVSESGHLCSIMQITICCYSDLNDLTGSSIAARMLWKLTVRTAMAIARMAAMAK